MGQQEQKKPGDWILLGTLVHGIQKGMAEIEGAATLEEVHAIAAAAFNFSKDIAALSGITTSEEDGVTVLKKAGRKALVGLPGAFGGPEVDPERIQALLGAKEPEGEEASEEYSVKEFSGSLADPLDLGSQLGKTMAHMLNIGPAETLGERVQWLEVLLLGFARGIKNELPIPAIAAIYASAANTVTSTYISAAQLTGQTDFHLKDGIVADRPIAEVKLSEYLTEKSPPELKVIFDWLEQAPEVMKNLRHLITDDDLKALGYAPRDARETRH